MVMWFGRARAGQGFTLIELLTVTGIAIVLGTLIVGALFSAQEAARTAYCRNNLNQLHKLIIIYTQTYGQFLPAFWHERWIGELGLAGGRWRADIAYQMSRPHIKYLWDQWKLFCAAGGQTFPPPTSNTYWVNMCNRMNAIYTGGSHLGVKCPKMENLDDINPMMPMVWNNYQPPGNYLGPVGGERSVYRSSAPVILCPSDTSQYRSDQGCFTSYMGLAKYGWWHRGDCPTTARYYEYHQLQEVTGLIYVYVCNTHRDWMQYTSGKCPTCGATLVRQQVRKPGMGLLLAETEPGTWQYGGCG